MTEEPTSVGVDDGVALAPRPRTAPGAANAADASRVDSGDEAASAKALEAVHSFLEKNAAFAAKTVDRYCSESKKLRALEGFTPRPRSKDAAIFLAGRVDWENGRIGMMHLPASITQRMANPPMSWRNFTPADYAGLDFGWLSELLVFDHWSLTGDGPLKDLDSVSASEAPIPNYIDLQNWVKLRLIKGKNEGELAQASVEVRHLADLCASSGTMIGEMIRAAMYGIERGVWQAAGLTPPESLPTSDDVQTIRHSARAGMYFLFPGVSREVKQKALKCIPARCAALTEAIGASASMRPALANTDDIDWLLAQEPCDLTLATSLSRGRPLPLTAVAEGFEGQLPLEQWMKALTDGGL